MLNFSSFKTNESTNDPLEASTTNENDSLDMNVADIPDDVLEEISLEDSKGILILEGEEDFVDQVGTDSYTYLQENVDKMETELQFLKEQFQFAMNDRDFESAKQLEGLMELKQTVLVTRKNDLKLLELSSLQASLRQNPTVDQKSEDHEDSLSAKDKKVPPHSSSSSKEDTNAKGPEPSKGSFYLFKISALVFFLIQVLWIQPSQKAEVLSPAVDDDATVRLMEVMMTTVPQCVDGTMESNVTAATLEQQESFSSSVNMQVDAVATLVLYGKIMICCLIGIIGVLVLNLLLSLFKFVWNLLSSLSKFFLNLLPKPSKIPNKNKNETKVSIKQETEKLPPSLDLSKYEELKVEELRKLLRASKLKTFGKKHVLIRRLVAVYLAQLETLTVRQLRPMMRSRGLKQYGTKAQMIQKIVEAGLSN